jgi:predicted Fe-Mo cluster-binding NifX family protein
MKIAIPTNDGVLEQHFGHSKTFTIFITDKTGIIESRVLDSPPHQQGGLPGWIAQQGVDLVIAGGMGRKAIEKFAQMGIEVHPGARGGSPDELVREFLEGTLKLEYEACDHGSHKHGNCGHHH